MRLYFEFSNSNISESNFFCSFLLCPLYSLQISMDYMFGMDKAGRNNPQINEINLQVPGFFPN